MLVHSVFDFSIFPELVVPSSYIAEMREDYVVRSLVFRYVDWRGIFITLYILRNVSTCSNPILLLCIECRLAKSSVVLLVVESQRTAMGNTSF